MMTPGRYANPRWVNVAEVVAAGLCSQCGACEAACPHRIVTIRRDADYRFRPHIDGSCPCPDDRPNLCVSICPGVHEDPGQWRDHRFAAASVEEWLAGPVDSVWVGHALDPAVRSRGTSGGAVTALLIHLLETGEIDGALVVGPTGDDPMQHRIHVARSRAEIEAAWGSKYYPMPIARHFRELVVQPGRYAVVLLGCHMRALRMLESYSKRLQASVVLRIGLICGYCSGFKATVDEALEQGFQDMYEVARVDYREGPWPGNVRLAGRDGRETRRLIYRFLERLPFTTNHRCMICSDLFNETADVVFGDAWLKGLTSRRDDGWSIVAARNAAASEHLRRAARAGVLHLKNADVPLLIKSQEMPLRYKKTALGVRYWFTRRILRRRLPDHDFVGFSDAFAPNAWNVLGNVLFLATLTFFFKRDKLRRFVFTWVPEGVLRWYVRLVFLMIGHDGRQSFLLKWLRGRDTALNCDA